MYVFGEILKRETDSNSVQKEILKFFPEIFKDLTLSAHFLYCSTNNVSQIILRRILEIGISVIYLWDQPYIYLKWKKLDEHIADLSFKEMIDHLNDVGYVEFVNIENSSEINHLVLKDEVNSIYRELSNVIHGKELSFESISSESFELNEMDLSKNLDLIIRVENILLKIYCTRFTKINSLFFDEFTPITKFKNV